MLKLIKKILKRKREESDYEDIDDKLSDIFTDDCERCEEDEVDLYE